MLEAIKSGLAAIRRARSLGPICYQRGTCQTVIETASKGAIVFSIEDSSGNLSSEQSWPWLVAVEDLVLDGIPREPERDDRILEEIGGRVFVYQICDVAGSPAWRYSDTGRSQFRIFTKLIEVR